MANEKMINTRIQLKYDTLINWEASTFKLKAGELAIVTLATTKDGTTAGTANQHPVLFKVGTGNHTFSELPYASALAADVYSWAKAANVILDGKTIKFVDAENNPIKSVELNYITSAEAQDLIDAALVSVNAAIDAINDEETGILAQAKSYVDTEDIFETDMNTINALGGIAANVNLNGLTTHEVLKKLLYPYVDATVGNATASPNGGTYEKGVTKTISQVSISITKKSEPITSVALYNGSTLIEEKTGDAVKNGGTITFSGLSVEVPTNGNQLTVKVTYPDANGNAKTVEKKTTAMTFVYPYYMGSCAAGTAIDEALVESLTKKVESKGNKSCTYTVEQGYMVFAYPKAHGVLKSILDPNNFETLGNYTRHEVNVTGLDGTSQAYYVYVSGSCSVSGFTVNFKY